MQALAKMALKKGDGFIVHSEEDLQDLQTLVHQPKVRKAAHPSYDVFKLDNTDKETSRSKLGLSGRVILFFGLVRAYKGLNYLLEAMPEVRKRIPDANLVVAGEFYDDKNKYVEQVKSLGIEDCVIIHDNYVPNEEVGSYFTASDVVVLPYVSATQSGIVQIAFGFNRPVITTDVGGLPEAVKDGVTGMIVPSADSNALADGIIKFFEEGRGEYFAQNIAQSCAEFSWDRMVETIESLGMEVIGC
jgi:glycosyltransferase involved in cell wall biosynthesis